MINLGSNGVVNVSGDLNLVFSLSLTTNDVGAGFSFDLLFGNSTFGSADFDADGDVDGADFLTWQRGFGVGTTKVQGDANADSVGQWKRLRRLEKSIRLCCDERRCAWRRSRADGIRHDNYWVVCSLSMEHAPLNFRRLHKEPLVLV